MDEGDDHPLGLADDAIEAIAFDRTDRGWIVTPGNVSVIDEGEWATYSRGILGLEHSVISALASDPAGRIWVGTVGDGLRVFDGKTLNTYLSGMHVTSIAFDHRGRAFVGTSGDGLIVSDGQSWRTYADQNSGLAGHRVNAVALDKRGQVWIATDQGLSMLESLEFMPVPEAKVALTDKYFAPDKGWFLLSILVILWLSARLNVLPGVGVGLALGWLSLLPLGRPILELQYFGDGFDLPWFLFPNPGVVATYCGAVAGIAGGLTPKGPRQSGWRAHRRSIVAAIIGLAFGWGGGYALLMFKVLSGPG